MADNNKSYLKSQNCFFIIMSKLQNYRSMYLLTYILYCIGEPLQDISCAVVVDGDLLVGEGIVCGSPVEG